MSRLLFIFLFFIVLFNNTYAQSEAYKSRIKKIGRELGVPKDYEKTSGLTIQPEATILVSAGIDYQGREQRLTPEALNAYTSMVDSAKLAGCSLMIVSAFRAVDYQKGIIERKLKAGQKIEDILKVNTAPGYSEHHTGRAIDITCPAIKDLVEAFDTTPEYKWLSINANRFGFYLSYPKGKSGSIIYEPWHWLYKPEKN